MTSTLMIVGVWFAVSALLCLLLGAVVRRGEEALDAPPASTPVRSVPLGVAATAPAPAVAPVRASAPRTRPVEVVSGQAR
jgi:hypothetical protein